MNKKRSKIGFSLFAIVCMIALAITAVSGTLFVKASADAGALNVNGGKYYTDFDTLEEAKDAAADINLEVASEGDVLMKNKTYATTTNGKAVKALPLRGNEFVSVFGTAQGMLANFDGYPIVSALEDEGFRVNRSLANYYESVKSSYITSGSFGGKGYKYGTEETEFNKSVKESYDIYDDVAVIILGRGGGEGSDMSTHTAEEAGTGDRHKDLYEKDGKTYKHFLQMTDSEEALLAHVKQQGFKKIVYLINCSEIFEMHELQNDDDIDGILWIGRPGETGTKAAAKILAGEVNPSGKTVDTWYKDFTADPTWQNFGDNSQVSADGASNAYLREDGSLSGYYGIDYEEDIYVGYRYYETKAATMEETEAGTGKAWYNDNVVYPFGYGLSYTSFEYEDMTVELSNGGALSTASAELFESADGTPAAVKTATATVTVRNTGDVAGKEAVELYVSAPYGENGSTLEKPHVALVGFGKTDILQPGEAQELAITFNIQDMASYDAGKGCYVLEKGEYTLAAMGNAHGWAEKDETSYKQYQADSFTLDADALLKLDDYSGKAIKNVFSKENGLFYSLRDNSGKYAFNKDVTSAQKQLSRSDAFAEFPDAPTKKDMTISDAAFDSLTYWDNFRPGAKVQKYAYEANQEGQYSMNAKGDYTVGDKTFVYNDDTSIAGIVEEKAGYQTDYPWVTEYNANKSQMDKWTQRSENIYDSKTNPNVKYEIRLSAMSGKDPYGTADEQKAWRDFMNQVSWEDLMDMVGQFQKQAFDPVGMNPLLGQDSAWNYAGTYCFTCNCILAATWNTELVEKQGKLIGNMALLSGNNTWWGGSAQTHRSPFGGRAFEYTSEDGILGGYISSSEIRGAQSKGLTAYVKHCALNDQETNRNSRNLMAWVSEQAIRELYLKPFQMCVQEGNSQGIMGAFARVGRVSVNVNYNYVTELFRNEWGCETLSCTTDMYGAMKSCSPLDMLVRAGTDNIATNDMVGTWDATKREVNGAAMGAVVTGGNDLTDGVQYYFTRKCAMIFFWTHANSGMNKNGVDFSGWETATLTATQGTALTNVTVAQPSVKADKAVYSVAAGELPDGLTVNADGSITGTPTSGAGTYKFTVKCTADNWITATKEYTMNVASAFTADYTEGFLGMAYDSMITSATISVDKGYKSVTYSLAEGALPKGVSIAANGLISGAPLETGSFPVVINVNAVMVTGSGYRQTTTVTDYEYPLTLSVAAGTSTLTFVTNGGSAVSAQTVENGAGATAPAAPVKDGYTFTGWYTDEACTAVYDFGNAVTGNVTVYAGWTKTAASADDLDDVKNDLNGVKTDVDALKAAGGGCGSLAGGSAMLIAASVLALSAAGAVIVRLVIKSKKD